MERNIVTEKDAATIEEARSLEEVPATPTPGRRKARPKADDYWDRLARYVPTEIIGAYLIIDGLLRTLLKGDSVTVGLFSLFVAGTIATWFFAKQVLGVVRVEQLSMSSLGFAVWIFAIGGWFASEPFYAPGWGTIAVVVFGVLVRIVRLPPLPAGAIKRLAGR